MMTKFLYTILFSLLQLFAFAQVGLGNNTPKGALDLNIENANTPYGLVLPTNYPEAIENPQGGAIANGTLIYDPIEDCIRVYTKDTWSPCLQIEDDETGWNDKHIVRWGYGNWGKGIGNPITSSLFNNDLEDPENYGLAGIYKKVPGIELYSFSIEQLEAFRYIDYRFDIVSVDASILSEKAMDELIDFAENGGYVFINLGSTDISTSPPSPIFNKLGFRNIENIQQAAPNETNNFTTRHDAILNNVFGNAQGGIINMGSGDFIKIPEASLPITHKIYAARADTSIGIFVTGPRNRIAIIDTNRVYENDIYSTTGTSTSHILMKNLAVEAINKTLTDF